MKKNNNNSESKNDYNSTGNEKHRTIMHDIRNLKRLTKEQMATVCKMSDDEKMHIITIYNNVMEGVTEIVNGL